MYSIPQAEHQDFVLQNISSEIIDHDISRFLEHHLKITGQEYSLGAGWPDQRIVRQLVLNASGLFIWAATAWRFIHNGREFAERRLSLILQSDISATAPERQLNEIYTTVLSKYIRHGDESVERLERLSRFRKVVGSIIILSSPLSVHAVSRLLNIAPQETVWTLNDLHSILDVPGNRSYPVRLHHPSFRDFLLNQQRCYDRSFWVDERQAHRILTDSCVQLMARSLRQDVCRQQVPGALVADVERSQIEQSLSPEIRYACLHWVWHLQRSDAQLYDNDQVHHFLQAHLLHWLEALAWIGAISEGILAILSLETLIPVSVPLKTFQRESLKQCKKFESPGLYSLVHDAWRFALHNRSIIEQAPLQIYCSALAFSPKKSSVRVHFERDIPSWIRMRSIVQADWDAMLQILEGHTNTVFSMAFSPDSKHIVSRSFDHTVRIWDARTRATVQKLEGHSDLVNSVAFSLDGKYIASRSNDHTVQLQDASTRDTVQILEGHLGNVQSMAFSLDGKYIVSVFNTNKDVNKYINEETYTMQLQDVSTKAIVQILKGHLGQVSFIAFSLNSKYIALGLYNYIIQLQNASTKDIV